MKEALGGGKGANLPLLKALWVRADQVSCRGSETVEWVRSLRRLGGCRLPLHIETLARAGRYENFVHASVA